MLWVKAFHIVFMVTWFAGLLYLPRLFVYHTDARDPEGRDRFVIMERKLFVIMTIGAVLTAVFGFWLLFDYAWQAYAHNWWLKIKLALVGALVGFHVVCYSFMVKLRQGVDKRGAVFYRWFNEIPALLLIGIVILVVVRPG